MSISLPFAVVLEDTATAALAAIKDKRVQELILKRAEQLALEPEKQGKPLTDDLAGFRSVRAVGQRYRIIYHIQEEQVVVVVVTLGLRKEGDRNDVYATAEKLARRGMLKLPDQPGSEE